MTLAPALLALLLLLAATTLAAGLLWWRARARLAALEATQSQVRRVAERQDAERGALEASNQFLQALLENLQVGIVACDANGVLTLFNRATRQFHGLPQEPIPAERWADHYQLYEEDGCTPMDVARVPLFRALRGERVEDALMVIAPGDAPPRTLVASGQAFHSNDGSLLGALVSMHDITAQRAAEVALVRANHALEVRVAERTQALTEANAALRAQIGERERAEQAQAESEAGWRAIFERLHEGFMLGELLAGPDGGAADIRHLAVNAAWEAMTGIPREEALGRTIGELMPGLEPEWVQDFARVVATGVPETFTRRVAPMDRWLEVNVFRPEPGRFAVLFVDATARVEAQQRLLDSEARLRFVMDSMPQKIFTATADGAVDYFNPQWAEFTGLALESILQWGWTKLVHPEDVEETLRAWRQSVRTGEPFQLEHRFRRADGEYRWHLSRAVARRDADGRSVMWVGTNSDVHDQAAAAVELRATSAALADADQRKSEFLALLAHELRNPLAPLSYALELLTTPRGAGMDVGQVTALMQRQVTQIVRLVDELLDVSRISRGTIELRPRQVELVELLRHTVDVAGPGLQKAGHALELELPDGPVWLEADPVRLTQVFSNLLTNAVKYTPPGGRISLHAQADDAEARVRISDTGVGIAADALQEIFAMFVQLDRRPERAQGGLGVGLSLVQRLVSLHGGSVTASSPGLGLGSTFDVRLPRGRLACLSPGAATGAGTMGLAAPLLGE